MMRRGTFLSRAAALLLFLTACAIVFLAFADPLLRQDRLFEETLTTIRAQHARFAAEAAALPRLRAALTAVRGRQGPRNAYVRGESASRAAASLLETVKTAVERGGATLVSAQVLAKSGAEADSDQAVKIAVRAQMTATPDTLLRVFHGIESGHPILFINDVAITGRHARRAVRGKNAQPESWEELMLNVRFAVTGFRRASAKPEARR